MFPRVIACCLMFAVLAACGGLLNRAEQPPPLPEPTEDRVGLPDDYSNKFGQFYVFDRPDNKQVRVVYANEKAVAGNPFAHGSIIVMETYQASLDADGAPVLGADGRYQRGELTRIFVMRKEKWFGRRYNDKQTGDWEYASYLPDKRPDLIGNAAVACAICHADAGASRDFVYRGNIFFSGASGAIPQSPHDQAPDRPVVLNYTFVPRTTTVKAGTTVTWTNEDQVRHTVTASDREFSALMLQGSTFSHTFSTPGKFDFFCSIHPSMKGTVVVER